jgi:hypothetical protein
MTAHTSVAFEHKIEKWKLYAEALVELGAAYGFECFHEFQLSQRLPDGKPNRCGFIFSAEGRGEVYFWAGDEPPTLAEVHEKLRDAALTY